MTNHKSGTVIINVLQKIKLSNDFLYSIKFARAPARNMTIVILL